MARVDVWYFCRECKRRRKAGDGVLFCPDCGGHVERIGYRQRPADTSPAPKMRGLGAPRRKP